MMPTRSEVRVKPSSNLDVRVHAPASLVRTTRELERFDHVGSQNSYFSDLVAQFGREVIGSIFTNITFGQQTRIYADPGSAVRHSFCPARIDGRCYATVSGHAIP